MGYRFCILSRLHIYDSSRRSSSYDISLCLRLTRRARLPDLQAEYWATRCGLFTRISPVVKARTSPSVISSTSSARPTGVSLPPA